MVKRCLMVLLAGVFFLTACSDQGTFSTPTNTVTDGVTLLETMTDLSQSVVEKPVFSVVETSSAVASSKPEVQCIPICQRFGFAESMAVICGSLPGADWEKADVIRETMRRLELTEADRDRILMVGDRKFDVLGAKECGLDCIGVEFFGYAEPGELAAAGAAAVVSTAEELEQFILSH